MSDVSGQLVKHYIHKMWLILLGPTRVSVFSNSCLQSLDWSSIQHSSFDSQISFQKDIFMLVCPSCAWVVSICCLLSFMGLENYYGSVSFLRLTLMDLGLGSYFLSLHVSSIQIDIFICPNYGTNSQLFEFTCLSVQIMGQIQN